MTIQQVSLEEEYAALRRELEKLTQQFEEAIQLQDLEARSRCNKEIAPVDYRVFVSLINTFPGVLTGKPTTIQLFEIRRNAGQVGKNVVGDFFKALQEIGAGTYEPGKHHHDEETDEHTRLGVFTANLDVFLYPESWEMKKTAARMKKAEAERLRREKYQSVLVFNCEECGSPMIEYDLTGKCTSCRHIHQMVKDIPVERLTVRPAESDKLIDGLEDWMNEMSSPPTVPKAVPVLKQDIDRVLKKVEGPPCGHALEFQFINENTGKPECKVCYAFRDRSKQHGRTH